MNNKTAAAVPVKHALREKKISFYVSVRWM